MGDREMCGRSASQVSKDTVGQNYRIQTAGKAYSLLQRLGGICKHCEHLPWHLHIPGHYVSGNCQLTGSRSAHANVENM